MPNQQRYPLRDHAGDLRARSGRALDEITDGAAAETLHSDDLQISAETLREQAAIAIAAGYPQLGANLTRAAELTAVPNAEVLRMYELLRPGRGSYHALTALADELEERYGAPTSAALVREAAAAYQLRGLDPPAE